MNRAKETHFLFSIFTSVTVPFCEKNCFKRSSDTCLGMFFTNKRVLMMIGNERSALGIGECGSCVKRNGLIIVRSGAFQMLVAFIVLMSAVCSFSSIDYHSNRKQQSSSTLYTNFTIVLY